ncbi:MAG TPA: hypothetical protein VM012_04395, partial [Flavitalea sp.]|nr:hypothetical protein [Flavitalea sp.]
FFWKRTTASAAIVGIVGGLLLSVIFNNYLPAIAGRETFMYTAFPVMQDGVIIYQIPFLVSMGWVFVITVLLMIIISLVGSRGNNPKAFEVDSSMFKVSTGVFVMILLILSLLAAIYVRFW